MRNAEKGSENEECGMRKWEWGRWKREFGMWNAEVGNGRRQKAEDKGCRTQGASQKAQSAKILVD
jgi:hypothetical protein